MSYDALILSDRFPRYTRRDPLVPVWNLTPDRGGSIVRFFDTPAVSPGGRFVACTRLPFEDRLPRPGEAAEIVVIDLAAGTETVVATSRGWEPQLGAQVNWGADDRTLLFGDVDVETWTPFTAKLDWPTGERERLNGPIYHASPDGRFVVGTNPALMCRTQTGYGVVLPPEQVPTRRGAPADDGVWLTDTQRCESKLLHGLADVAARFGEGMGLDGGADAWQVYAFHSKFAPSGDRLLFTTRSIRAGYDGPEEPIGAKEESGLRFAIFTSRSDGSELSLALPAAAWRHGGHHINFYPDGNALSTNLGGFADDPRELRFVRCDATGGNLRAILPDVVGGGHPSLHPNGTHLLTDCYYSERWTDADDGTVPLRWVDVRDGSEREVCRVVTRPPHAGVSTLRVDPHPCWDRSWRYVTFTGVENGARRIFLADMRPLLGEWLETESAGR